MESGTLASSLLQESDRMLVRGAEDGGIDYPLTGSADFGREGSLHGFTGFETIDKILHRILLGRNKRIDRNVAPLRVLQGLQADGLLKVAAGHTAFLTDDDESVPGLRLVRPRVGVRPPASLKPGKTRCITGDCDAVLVHFEIGRFVDHTGTSMGALPPWYHVPSVAP